MADDFWNMTRTHEYFALTLSLALLAVAGAGCHTPHASTTPVSNGFEEVSHPDRTYIMLDDPKDPRIELQYRATNGTITPIWPSLFGVAEVIKGNEALFVGDKAYTQPDRVTKPRLFAVKAPGVPLDLTDEVLRRWARANDRSFNSARDRLAMITPVEDDERVEMRLDFTSRDSWISNREDWPDQSTLRLTWPQIEQLMQVVKTNGVPKTDLRWNTPYIGDKH
jgi:hypothetical protein